MKKIVSNTILTALAATNLTTIAAQSVSATTKADDSINANINEEFNNSIDVTVEDTESIESSNTENSSNNDETGEGSINSEINDEDNELNKDEEIQTDIDNSESFENNSDDLTLENNPNEEVSNETTSENTSNIIEDVKRYGKLEFDMNFAMPVKDLNSIGLSIFKDESKIIQNLDLSLENGDLENGITYKVEKLNSKRLPLEDGQKDIYFLHITIEKLKLGTYAAEIKSEGYIDTKVENIEIKDFSKRVILGSSNNESLNYNGVFLAGDVNGDGKIDMGDYDLVFENIGTSKVTKDTLKFDINKDGKIDIADLTYINSNMGATQGKAVIENTDAIIDVNSISVDESKFKLESGTSIKDIFIDNEKSVSLGKNDGQAPSEESPLVLGIDLSKSMRGSKEGIALASENSIEMEQIVIKAPKTSSNSDASMPEKGSITYVDENGVTKTVEFNENSNEARSKGSNGDIVIDLGTQVAVKQISINVTANRGNKNISEIAKIEFLNNVYKEVPKPDMNIPTIKTLETSTNLHDERITISWEAQPNVTSYEVMYQKLNENGQVISTKKLQTNKTNLNILDKDIKPYDLYRVSIQSLNGEWSSGYLTEEDVPSAFDRKADNVDANFNPIDSYYNGDKGSVSEIQVIPLNKPEPPRNLTTDQGYKSFTVKWEQHSQARDFDIYYRKIGDSNKNWIKANDNHKEVVEGSEDITNPDKNKLVRSHSYTVNGLEDNVSYEVRVTATNHLGTSEMSKAYIASTTSVNPPKMQEYKLINRPTTENEIGTTHIVDVRNKKDSNGWASQDDGLHYDSKYALVDGDFTTEWKVNDWDTGASYGADRGSEITFDDTYTIGKIGIGRTLQKGHYMGLYKVKVTYWDENDNKNVIYTESISEKSSNGHSYYMVNLNEPIRAKKIKVDTSGYGGSTQIISELKFYEYDSLADDIKNLYKDDLRLVLKESVTQNVLDELSKRLNIQDDLSGEYHPDKAILEKELDVAQKLFNDKEVSEKVTTLDASIRTDNEGPSLGMENSYQSLGSVARPSVDDNGTSKQIVVYMGSSDPNTKVDIVFLQNYGLPTSYMSKVYTISPGRTEITIPSIISADVEKGGQVMARVTQGSTSANVQIRLSGVTDIPHLNVNNIINDSTKEEEVKDKIRAYINELKTYISDIKSLYPTEVSDKDKINNIYLYDKETSPLNTTDIEGDRFTLTLPASEILRGIEEGLENDIEAQVERVHNALLAWEQEVQVGFAKKGVFEEVKDFNGNGEIDSEDREYFKKHRAPLTRLNIKYQRMMMGAAAYASSHHIGVGFNSASYIQGVPYKIDSMGDVVNKDEAHLYGGLICHEM